MDCSVGSGASADTNLYEEHWGTRKITHWLDFITDVGSTISPHLLQARDLVIGSLCSGLGTESSVAHRMGIRTTTLFACDIKAESLDFHKRRSGMGLGDEPLHFYKNVFDLLGGLQGQPDKLQCVTCLDQPKCNPFIGTEAKRVDLLVGGFPCQPYSLASTKRFLDGGPKAHPKSAVTQSMADSVALMKPHAFIFENVPGFGRAVGAEEPPLKAFLAQLDGDYIVQSFKLSLSDWIDVDRQRLAHGFKGCSVSLAMPA
eukprot:5492420-Pyramimonas_sp.AAC.1